MPRDSDFDPIPTSSPPPTQSRQDDSQDSVPSSPPWEHDTYPNTVDAHVTQPTQLLSARPPAKLSDIVVPETSPERPAVQHTQNRVTGFSRNSGTEQQSVFSRMAPPGTYLNVPVFPNSQRNPILVDSDDENDKGTISDSEDDMLHNRADIPAARTISQPRTYDPPPLRRYPSSQTTSFISSKWGLKPINKTSSSSATARDANPAVLDAVNLTKVRSMQVILPDRTETEIVSALRKHKWNKDDAVDSFFSELEDVSSPQNREVVDLTSPVLNRAKGIASSAQAPAKRQNFHQRDNKQSIAQKYKHIQSKPSPAVGQSQSTDKSQESVVPKKRKLVQGRKRSSSPVEEIEQEAPPAKRKLVQGRKRKESSEPEEIVEFQRPKQKIQLAQDLSDDTDATDTQQDNDDEVEDVKLLSYLNSCNIDQLADLAGAKQEDAAFLISKRPFASLEEIRLLESEAQPAKSGRGRAVRRKAIGDKILDASSKMWRGLQAIDFLVESCDGLNKKVKSGMQTLGLQLRGNELQAARFETDSRIDSGTGSPAVTTSKRLQKPAIMSGSLELKSHQLVGLNWLNLLYTERISAILADDMGLGKTCQVIAFLSHLAEQGIRGPHLIIVPGSTLENWMREFQRFSPDLNIYPFHGSQSERLQMQDDVSEGGYDVVLTTYDIATKPEDNRFFRKLKPLTVVFDEGHMLKNKQSNRFKQLIKISTPWRLLLTGTPLQNNLLELISILHFLMPDMFQEQSNDLDYIFKYRAKTTDEEHTALLSVQRVNKARQMMAPFVLRRKKEHIDAELPLKIRRIEYCDLTERQLQVYTDYTEIHQEALKNRAAGVTTIPQNFLMDRRKAAIHPLLFRYLYQNDDIAKMHKKVPRDKGIYRNWSAIKMEEEMSWWSDFKTHQLCLEIPSLSKYALQEEEWMDSGKVVKVLELLKKFDEQGSRTLLFSQFTMVLDILESVFITAGIKFCRLDGSTPIAARQDWIDTFHQDESYKVFMLSTKSGGTGINLACANKVIIFDASFNPQDDIQAENRAHRFGQTKEVEVVRLISRGTVEEQIHTLCEGKLALEGVVTGDEAEIQKQGIEMVEKLLAAQEPASAVTDAVDAGAATADATEAKAPEAKGRIKDEDVKDAFLQGLRKAGLKVQS